MAEDILLQVDKHYISWKEDNDKRRTRKNGWNDVTNAYWGKLPSDWPYTSKVVDPRIRTSLTEKNARLLNGKLRGRLVPREGGDVLKARINNALLDFQWDNANYGGSMLSKWAAMDMDSRLFASKFALVLWRHEENDEGEILFDGNEMYPLDIRDCGIDPTATHIRDAKWFQYRDWVKIEDLNRINETSVGIKYPGLSKLKKKIEDGDVSQNRRDSEYQSQLLSNKGLTDRTGEDKSFPVVERVREYRKDRWICYFPKYKVLGYDIDNPYEHGQIPVIQLRYYPLGDDPIGESEVEPVIPLWKGINATLCGYLDNMNIHMRPPLKILPGANIDTIIWGAEAQWQMSKPDDVTEMQSGGEAMRYFQTTYSALVSAFNTAMGDMSQGQSAVDPFNPNKTATEVRQTVKQQNVRDQANQMYLGESISDMMMMWLVNNKQFLFLDQKKQEYILRVIGSDLFEYFKRAGLDEMEVKPEAMQMIGDIIQAQEGNMNDGDVNQLYEAAKTPKFPVFDNPNEKDPEKLKYKSKLRMNDMEDGGELSLIPEDLDGTYDYIADVVSMAAGASDQLLKAQQNAVTMLTTNPVVLQLLAQQGVQPQIKDLLISVFDQAGLKDAERYFQTTPPPQPTQVGVGGINGPGGPVPQPGVPNPTSTPTAGGLPTAMAGPQGIPQSGGIPASV
jgi:hypothetical protein